MMEIADQLEIFVGTTVLVICGILSVFIFVFEAGEGPFKQSRSVHRSILRSETKRLREIALLAYKEKVAKLIRGDVRMIAACKDHQRTGDTPGGGVCTNALIEVMKPSYGLVGTWWGLLKGMEKFSSGEVVVSMSRKFELSEGMSFRNKSGDGKTRSLLIGINYAHLRHKRMHLFGCHRDVSNMKTFIASHGYSLERKDCRTLMDNGEEGRYPDKKGILAGFKWLLEGAVKGDSLLFFFAGHGIQVKDVSGDEEDGEDEAIMPADYKKGDESSLLIDDDIYQELVLKVPEGVTLVSVIDGCCSGTILDLPYSKCAGDITNDNSWPKVEANPRFTEKAKKAAWFKIDEDYEKEDELSGRLSEALVLFQSGEEVWANVSVRDEAIAIVEPRTTMKKLANVGRQVADIARPSTLFTIVKTFSDTTTFPRLRLAGECLCYVIQQEISRQAVHEEYEPMTRRCQMLFSMLEMIKGILCDLARSKLGGREEQAAHEIIGIMYDDIHDVMKLLAEFRIMKRWKQMLWAQEYQQRLTKATKAIERAEENVKNICHIATSQRVAG